MDFLLNGNASGSVATRLLNSGGDINILRPYIDQKGRHCISVPSYNAQKGAFEMKKVVLQQNAATLRYEDWRLLDTQVLKAARQRLGLVADLRSSGLQFTIGNGLGKTIFSTETMSDPGSATISMDGIKRGEGDRPIFEMTNLPLPIIHADFSFPLRQVLVSRNSNTPLDTSMAEAASRRVAETVEKLALGTYGSFSFGGANLYGLTNYPNRITKTLTAPTATAWTPNTTVLEVLDMKQKSIDKFNYGPWKLYVSTKWDQYLDRDYTLTGGNNPNQTLRERLTKINGITSIKTLDFLPNFQMVLLQQTTETFREIIGLDFTTVQWETQGGMEINFKVMAIMVPQPRADINGNCGIVHGS